MRRSVAWLSVAATVGMFLVLLMGATVTNTGSAQGCGQHWPLCNGRFIPEFALQTAIEFSHRAVTGLVGLLVVGLAAGSWLLYRQRLEIRALAPLMVLLILIQSGLGAWAVMVPQASTVLALHFGISLLSFASVFLTMVLATNLGSGDARRGHPIPTAFQRAVWASLAATYVVVYLGAFVRHTGASLACLDWPLCNGALLPGFGGAVGAVFIHRLGALLIVAILTGLAIWGERLRSTRPDIAWGTRAALALVVLQVLVGAAVVLTRLSLWSALAHAGVMTLLFGSLAYLCLQVLPLPTMADQVAERPVGRRLGVFTR